MNTIKRDPADGTYDILTEAGDRIGYIEKERIQSFGYTNPGGIIWWVWEVAQDNGVIYDTFAEAKRVALALGTG